VVGRRDTAPVRRDPARPGRLRRVWDLRVEWGAGWAARVVALLGVVSVLSAIFPPIHRRLEWLLQVLPDSAPGVAAGATTALGLMLLALSSGLRQRKHGAWLVAVVTSGALVLLHLVKGLDVEEALLSVGVLVLLLVTRPAFTGARNPRSARRAVAVFAGSLSAATATGVGLLMVDPDDVLGSPSFRQVLEQVWFGFAGLPGGVRFTSSLASGRIATTLLLLGIAVAALTLTTVLRPAGGPHPIRPEETEKVRGLLTAPGSQDSLGYFALREDKSVLFSPSGKAAIAYRVVGGVCLASGDPLGDSEAWPAAIAAWLDQARAYAWIPAVLGTGLRGAQAYRRAGLDALEFGDEAIVEVGDFSLEGRSMRGVRQAVSRLQRQGVTVRVDRLRDLDAPALAQLRDRAEHWRDGQVERGFSMALGRFADPRDPDVVVTRCFDETGALQGLLGFVPWGKDGLSLDVMRRSPRSPNGVVELMVTTLLAQAPGLGVTRLSLNFAVFRSVFERGGRLGAGPVLRLWHRLLLVASRFWQLESLYRANAKYHPNWQPRFMCFSRARDLPRIGAAVLTAEAFLCRPHWLGGGK